MITNSTDLEKFLMRVMQDESEPFYEQYRHHLLAIADILIKGRTNHPNDHAWHMEGGLFYGGVPQWPLEPEKIEKNFALKRRNFLIYVTTGETMLEIGFNAGHSAMLALTINPRLRITAVDLGWHPYTKLCFEYLQSVFPGRVEIYLGDSREVVPTLQGRHFDLFHIDAAHTFNAAQADLMNVYALAKKNQTILVDDMDFKNLRYLVDYYCLKGLFSKVDAVYTSQFELQAFLRVN